MNREQPYDRWLRTAGRHDETPTESGCIFAAALIVVLAIIFITLALLP